ncbi:MAG: hypothetical protein VW709_21740, partial [Rickettsiales bacterium]
MPAAIHRSTRYNKCIAFRALDHVSRIGRRGSGNPFGFGDFLFAAFIEPADEFEAVPHGQHDRGEYKNFG